MVHEPVSNPEIAVIVNQHFVNIKVDRKERPDLDQVYQSPCQLVTKSGGWPLSVWPTPGQKPFYVGTYFPPAERYGRPEFKQLVQGRADRPEERRFRRGAKFPNTCSLELMLRHWKALPGEDAPIWAGRETLNGLPTAYVCRNFACSPPATSWEALEQNLG